jgi:predicted signal transduction protein with EAL and GGDEF domain
MSAPVIGVAVYPTDGADATILLANADAALYRAKVEARGSIRFYDVELERELRDHHALQHDLSVAVDRGELSLHYQPLAKVSGEVLGFEVLLRWQHPIRGMVLPTTFIPLAEKGGLIISIGEWVLRKACHEAASWPKPLRIAVNLSPMQFHHRDLPALVHLVLLETGLSPNRLELEITESLLIDDFSRGVSMLRRLKRHAFDRSREAECRRGLSPLCVDDGSGQPLAAIDILRPPGYRARSSA